MPGLVHVAQRPRGRKLTPACGEAAFSGCDLSNLTPSTKQRAGPRSSAPSDRSGKASSTYPVGAGPQPSIVLSGRLSAFCCGQASTLTLHWETYPAGCTGSHKPYLIIRKPEPSWLPA